MTTFVSQKMTRRNIPRRHVYIMPEQSQPFYWDTGCKSPWSIISSLNQDATNEIRNPSFERNITGWQPWAETQATTNLVTLSRDNTVAYAGIASLKVTAPAGAPEYGTTYAANEIQASVYPAVVAPFGDPFYGTVRVKGCPGDTITMQLVMDGDLPPGVNYQVEAHPVTVQCNGDWHELSTYCLPTLVATDGTVAIPTGAPVRMEILNDNASRCGSFHVDAASMTELEAQYFDWDTFGVTWDGTPHLSTSTASRYTRGLGAKVNFSDLGFNLFGDEGHGYPPIENITRSYAQRNGASLQGSRLLPRVITLQLEISSCCGPEEIHEMRRKLINALSFPYNNQCPQEIKLSYQLFDDCCNPTTSELTIPVVLEGGLQSLRTSPFTERIALQFVANTDVMWSETNDSAKKLTTNGAGTAVVTKGSGDVYPVLNISAGSSPLQVSGIVNDSVESRLTLGVPNPPYTIPAGQTLVINTNPQEFSMTLEPSGVDVKGQLNYPLSDLTTWRFVQGYNSVRLETAGTVAANSSFWTTWKEQHLSTDGVTVYKTCCGGC